MRHKEIYAIKVHGSIKFAADFALSLVTEKLKSRIHFFTSLDSVKGIDRSILPLEYGGTIPMIEMIGFLFYYYYYQYFILLNWKIKLVHLFFSSLFYFLKNCGKLKWLHYSRFLRITIKCEFI